MLWEGNYSWMHISPLASIKMSNSGSVCESEFVPQLSVSHEFERGPCHPKGSWAEAMPGHCQPADELVGSSYDPLAICLSLPAHLMFRYSTHETAPLGWESRATFLALPFSVTFTSLICRPTPPEWAARECPKKKSFFPAGGGLLVPLLENYRHLETWL